MNSLTEAMPLTSTSSRGTKLERVFRICYLTSITVSTLGWVSAFGWITFTFAKWMMA
jgi:hypothetical protein